MAKFDLTFRELEEGRLFAIGEAHVIRATKGRGHLVEMEDLNFHFDSAVLLPDPKCDDAAANEQDRITGLSVLAACLRHADDHPRERLLIAGHTDTQGAADFNVTLSQQRADNVFFALTGDKDAWAGLSQKRHQVEDVQAILKWIDRQFGFGCDPGAIDNQDGPKTQGALKAFQQRFNEEEGGSLAVNGKADPGTWGAFFDMYMRGLRQVLAVDEAGLSALRGKLAFLDEGKKTVGCGENHPIEAAGKDNFRSATNRRVELLFFDPADALPKLDCHPGSGKCEAKLCQIYGKGFFDFKHLPCGAPTAGFSGAFALAEQVDAAESEAPPQETGDVTPDRPRGRAQDIANLEGDA